jgi:membrane protease YdiL (CAAX protease family)
MSQAKPYVVGFLGNIAVAFAILVFMYATTFNPENVNAFYVMVMLLIGGISLAVAMVGVRFETFNSKYFFETVLWSVLSFTMIFIVNRTVPVRIGISPVGETLFAILAGVSEECFFRLWLCTAAFKFTRSTLIAIIVSSLSWTIYHIGRYGGNWSVLLIIFGAGCVQGWIMLASRMGDGPIFGHMLVNAVAR